MIRAHIGGAASSAASAIRAKAYTLGRHVVFQGKPDLRTTAHEAAHAMQQAAGTRPPGGAGVVGDRFEKSADAVAERVVAGQSAEPVLEAMAPAPQGGAAALSDGAPAVQRLVDYDIEPGTRVIVSDVGTAGEDFGAPGTIVRKSSLQDGRTLVVRFDDEPQSEYRVDIRELDRFDSAATALRAGLLTKLRRRYDVGGQADLHDFTAPQGQYASPDDYLKALQAEMRDRLRTTGAVRDVSGLVMRRLQAAQEVIDRVKVLLAGGAGNQAEAQDRSHGNAGVRSAIAGSTMRWGYTTDHEQPYIESMARQTILAGGGTCQQYAALTYKLLQEMGVGPLSIVALDGGGDHTFVIIGDPAAESEANIVAVDPWPTVSQAVTLDDHFSGGLAKLKNGSFSDRPRPLDRLRPPASTAQDLVATRPPGRMGALLNSGLEYAPGVTRSLRAVMYRSGNDVMDSVVNDFLPPMPNFDRYREQDRLQALGQRFNETDQRMRAEQQAKEREEEQSDDGPAAASSTAIIPQSLVSQLDEIEQQYEVDFDDEKARSKYAALIKQNPDYAAYIREQGSHVIGSDEMDKIT